MWTGEGQRVLAAMQDGVLNLCARQAARPAAPRARPLTEYSQYGEGIRSATLYRAPAMISAAASPAASSMQGLETDPDAYIYFITQAAVWT